MNGLNDDNKTISAIAQCLFSWIAQWCKNAEHGLSEQAPATINRWTEREWKIAKAVIIVHGMGPTLGYLLNQQGDHSALPPQINTFLRNQFEQNHHRIQMIAQTKHQISEALQRERIPFVCFKGLTLACRIYPDIGMRPMADIDIYTGRQNKEKLGRVLTHLDYQPHVVTPEGMTWYRKNCSTPQDVNWEGAAVTAEDDSIWYQGEHVDLPFSVDIHFSMRQGIQEFRYDLDPMFQQALRTGHGLSVQQTYIHLLLHASKHFRCHCARWIQLYDLYLFQQKVAIDEKAVLNEAIEQDICHWLLWPLLLTRQTFKTDPTDLEQKLFAYTSRRYRWLFEQHGLADLSHCNPKAMSLLYSLLWTQNFNKIRQWLKLSSKASVTESKRDNQQLNNAPPMASRMVNRVKNHFNPNTRQQWQIFAQQGLAPHKDWM